MPPDRRSIQAAPLPTIRRLKRDPMRHQGRTTKIGQKSEIACKSVPTVLRCNCHAYQPDATNQLRAVSCGSPKNLLLCKCHAIPTAEICPEYTRNTANSGTEHPPSEKKYRATLDDIGGHWGTYVPLSRQNDRISFEQDRGSGRPLFQFHTHASDGTNCQKNQDVPARLRTSKHSALLRK